MPMPRAASTTPGSMPADPGRRCCARPAAVRRGQRDDRRCRADPADAERGQRRAADVASADSGTISRPNSAIEGIVCNRLSATKSGACERARAAAQRGRAARRSAGPARPRPRPARYAAPAHAANTSRRLWYSRASDSASNMPASAIAINATAASAAAMQPGRRGSFGSLQRIDERQRGGAEDDPEPGAKRYPRCRGRSGGEGCRGVAGGGERRRAQRRRRCRKHSRARASERQIRSPAALPRTPRSSRLKPAPVASHSIDRSPRDEPVRRQADKAAADSPDNSYRDQQPATPGCAACSRRWPAELARRRSSLGLRRFQVIRGDGARIFAVNRDPRVQRLQLLSGQRAEHAVERRRDARVLVEASVRGRPAPGHRLLARACRRTARRGRARRCAPSVP